MKEVILCSLCKGRGALWLRAGDYLECPQCEGRGRIEVETHRVDARVRRIFIPGLPSFETVELPQRSLIGDTEIRRI